MKNQLKALKLKNITVKLNHVAILTKSAENAAALCKKSGYETGPVEDFPAIGTREIYIGSFEKNGLLLLMQAVGPGPYLDALEKRGPGLHHIAVDVDSIESYLSSLAGSGWLLHPQSLHTMKHSKTIYLARPGFKALIEVQEVSQKSLAKPKDLFISDVFIEGGQQQQNLLNSLQVSGLHIALGNGSAIVIDGKRISVADLAMV